ncbi:MAG TPA: cell division ATPase MinD [Methanocella sp.]|nr:cell division ATPase MinD [Methanocella sp.]
MGDDEGLKLSKRWDAERGRMTLLAHNGGGAVDAATVEDSYPASIEGVLCFARSGGMAPAATAAGGKITWHLRGLRPGDVRELAYTSLSPEALNDPAARKVPSERDRALLGALKDLPPRLVAPEAAPPAGAPEGADQPGPAEPEPLTPAMTPAVKGAGRVIAIGAGKGGTGKTTFAISFAVALAELGFETVLLDADASMSNLGPYMGIDVQSMKATLHDVLAGEAEPEKAVYRAFSERLRVVPSGLSIAGFLNMDRSLLADVIRHFAAGADFIVIDTPAGYNKEVALSLKASDDLLLVLNPDEGSLIDGLKVQEMARILGVNVRGIVLNRHDMRGYQYSRGQIEAYFGTEVIAALPEDANVRRKDRLPVVLSGPGSRTAQEIVKVARLISGRPEAPAPAPRPFATRLMEALFKA